MRKILVTGGVGFIGFYITKILSEDDRNIIHVVDDLSKSGLDDQFKNLLHKSNVKFFQNDLTDLGTYNRIDANYDQIYHLAAIIGVKKVTNNPVLTIKTNTLSTIYLLEFISKMPKHPKLVFASSSENYAGTINSFGGPIPTPEKVPLCIQDIFNPRWTYAATKILGEIACIQYSMKYGFDTTIVRYHNVYGPRMGTQHVIPEFVLRLKQNPRVLNMFGGNQKRSFCYCTDAAKMTINLMNCVKSNNLVVNIGNPESFCISYIAKEISRIMGTHPKIKENGAPEGSVEERIPDLSLIQGLGAFVAEVPFSEGLKKTSEWYNSNDYLNLEQ